jgi:two-component system CheB/CheR fusion protein
MTDIDPPRQGIPLVVIGASAGGLEPLEAFFEAAPTAAGWAYVVVQHLSPEYRSRMDELLARRTRLAIRHIEDGLSIAPDTLYLNRPNLYVEIRGDRFHESPYAEDTPRPHLPVDEIFRSLSERSEAPGVGVVLSGSGRDGARGARMLRAKGVPVLAQTPGEARFASMPMAVIEEGAADSVLRAADMPSAIATLFSDEGRAVPPGHGEEAALARILRLLEENRKIDFTAYRHANVQRRIQRRQQLRGFGTMPEYAEFLAGDRGALEQLYQDLLIGVTQFYRDPEAMAALRTQVLEPLARAESDGTPIRIWVPACASGEEAYSIAIELTEALAAAGSTRKFRIIATDVHRGSLERASLGIYNQAALANVPPAHLARYFERQGSLYVVDPVLRQKMIFSTHDVLRDPPFMNLDLISCRNLFIYLREEPQAQVLSMFLFGLRYDGHLLLGSSESIGRFTEEFTTLDPRWRIYRKTADRRFVDPGALHHKAPVSIGTEPVVSRSRSTAQDRTMIADIADIRNRDTLIKSYNLLLRRYAPSSILITGEGMVLGWFGAAAAFVDTMNNLADWTVEGIVHPDLHFTINVGMEKLRQGALEVFVRSVTVTLVEGRRQPCTVRIEALDQSSRVKIMLVAVTMEGAEQEVAQTPPAPPLSSDDMSVLTSRVRELERDLRLSEQTLKHVTERLEASGEELQASNEELQASNEELQASNEELQASNEELHAVNEELVSVSAEHERKIQLLQELNASTEFVLDLMQAGVILVTSAGMIHRFSAMIERDFGLLAHDVDRPLSTVGPRLDFADLAQMAARATAEARVLQARGEIEGRAASVRVAPAHRSELFAFDGTVIVIAYH